MEEVQVGVHIGRKGKKRKEKKKRSTIELTFVFFSAYVRIVLNLCFILSMYCTFSIFEKEVVLTTTQSPKHNFNFLFS